MQDICPLPPSSSLLDTVIRYAGTTRNEDGQSRRGTDFGRPLKLHDLPHVFTSIVLASFCPFSALFFRFASLPGRPGLRELSEFFAIQLAPFVALLLGGRFARRLQRAS